MANMTGLFWCGIRWAPLLIAAGGVLVKPCATAAENAKAAAEVSEGARVTEGGRRWAVLVGVDVYEHDKEINSLRCAVADVKAVATALKQKLGCSEATSPRTLLLFTSSSPKIFWQRDDGTREPMTEDIINCLREEIAPFATEEDTLIFYFSGHGMIDDSGNSCLLTKRTVPSRESLSKTSLGTDFLWSALDRVKARHKLVILDCCRNSPTRARAGGVTDRNEAVSDKIDEFGTKGTKLLLPAPPERTREVAVTLFACKKGERAYECARLRQGYFSYHLVQGLTAPEAARDGDGNVTLGTLTKYLEFAVPKAVAEDIMGRDAKQTPWVRYEGQVATDWVLVPADSGEIALMMQAGRSGEDLPADLELAVGDKPCRSGQAVRVPFDRSLRLRMEGSEWELAEAQPAELPALRRQEKRRELTVRVWRRLSRGRLRVACLDLETKQPVRGLFLKVGDNLLSADQTEPYPVPLEVPLDVALSPHPRWGLARLDQPTITLTRAKPQGEITVYVKPKRGSLVVETLDMETRQLVSVALEVKKPDGGVVRVRSGEPLKDLEIGVTCAVGVEDEGYEFLGEGLKAGPSVEQPEAKVTAMVARRRGCLQLVCLDEKGKEVNGQFTVDGEPRFSGRELPVPLGQDIEVRYADPRPLAEGQEVERFRLSHAEPRKKLTYRVRPLVGPPRNECLVTVEAVEAASGKPVQQVPLNLDGKAAVSGYPVYKPTGARLTIGCQSDKWEPVDGKMERTCDLPRDEQEARVTLKVRRKESTADLQSTPVEAILRLEPIPDPGCSTVWWVEQSQLTVRTNHGPVRLPVGTYRITAVEAGEGFLPPRDVACLQVPGDKIALALARRTQTVVLQTTPAGAEVTLTAGAPRPGDDKLIKEAEGTAWSSSRKLTNAQVQLPLGDYAVALAKAGCVPVRRSLRITSEKSVDITSGQSEEWKAVKLEPERGTLTLTKVLGGARWKLVPVDWLAYESREAMQEVEKHRLEGIVPRPRKGEVTKALLPDVPVGKYELVVRGPEGVRCKEDPTRREVTVMVRGSECEVKQEREPEAGSRVHPPVPPVPPW